MCDCMYLVYTQIYKVVCIYVPAFYIQKSFQMVYLLWSKIEKTLNNEYNYGVYIKYSYGVYIKYRFHCDILTLEFKFNKYKIF